MLFLIVFVCEQLGLPSVIMCHFFMYYFIEFWWNAPRETVAGLHERRPSAEFIIQFCCHIKSFVPRKLWKCVCLIVSLMTKRVSGIQEDYYSIVLALFWPSNVLSWIGNQLTTPCLFVRHNHSFCSSVLEQLTGLPQFLNPMFNFLQAEFLLKFKAELF